jgi:Pre-mRNA-splicing factor SF3a complex subunit 2 (Prp11)
MQGKNHQQGLARRAHNEKLAAHQQEQQSGTTAPTTRTATVTTWQCPIRIGRPAYQVFKSRDAETNQRCLSFELHYPELDVDRIQPRHRFMSSFTLAQEAMVVVGETKFVCSGSANATTSSSGASSMQRGDSAATGSCRSRPGVGD